MTTLTKILSAIPVWCICLIDAQQIAFENIDSSNALNLIARISTENIASESSVIQNGTRNFAELSLNGKTDISVHQLGDYNFLNFSNTFDSSAANPVITTQGNNNIIDVVGSNSISEKIQIHVKGDNTTIFMRNF